MKNSTVGFIGVIFGSMVLSIELYCLKIIQGLQVATGEWHSNAMDYAAEMPQSLALIITVGVIMFSFVLIYNDYKKYCTNLS